MLKILNYMSNFFNKVATYFSDVKKELVEKTTWPSWNDLFSSARIVMVASVIIAIIICLMDLAFENVLKGLYNVLY